MYIKFHGKVKICTHYDNPQAPQEKYDQSSKQNIIFTTNELSEYCQNYFEMFYMNVLSFILNV